MSDNIFAEIYNKILGLFGQNTVKDESKNTAVNRLRLVLMQDRTNLTPEIMNRMRAELIEVLSKYVELDKEALDLNIGQEGEQMALMLSIPVIRAKDEAEIQEALEKEEKAKEKAEAKDEAKDDESDETTDEEESAAAAAEEEENSDAKAEKSEKTEDDTESEPKPETKEDTSDNKAESEVKTEPEVKKVEKSKVVESIPTIKPHSAEHKE